MILKYLLVQLFFLLRDTKKKYVQRKGTLTYGEWEKVVPILIKAEQSDFVLHLLTELNAFGFLIKTKTISEFITGALLHLDYTTVSEYSSLGLKGFENLLRFLQVEESVINSLLKKTSDCCLVSLLRKNNRVFEKLSLLRDTKIFNPEFLCPLKVIIKYLLQRRNIKFYEFEKYSKVYRQILSIRSSCVMFDRY